MTTLSAPPAPHVLVGEAAPDFTAPAVMPNNEINQTFNLRSYLSGSYGLVFFYPQIALWLPKAIGW